MQKLAYKEKKNNKLLEYNFIVGVNNFILSFTSSSFRTKLIHLRFCNITFSLLLSNLNYV